MSKCPQVEIAELKEEVGRLTADNEYTRSALARLRATAKLGGSDVCITCAAHVLVITEDLHPKIERLTAENAELKRCLDGGVDCAAERMNITAERDRLMAFIANERGCSECWTGSACGSECHMLDASRSTRTINKVESINNKGDLKCES